MNSNLFLNGNYINYTGANNYSMQDNNIGSPPFTYGNQNRCKYGGPELQTDGKYSRNPPYYQLGPDDKKNCVFYNYTLPYNYPWSGGSSMPDPKNYWYYPYYKNPTFYDNPLQIPKAK